MFKYIATIRVKGTTIQTAVFADSAVHARLILEYQFGMGSVVFSPTISTKEDINNTPIEEVIKSIQSIKPKTPQQLTIDTLKKQKDQAAERLKAEKDRQKIIKAQHSIFNLSRSIKLKN
jgi:hypothetical protein